MTRSLNTTFYGLAYEVGPENVARHHPLGRRHARRLGGRRTSRASTTLANAGDGGTGSAIGIGEYEMRPIDQAHGFATFANGGVAARPVLRRAR